MEVEALISTYTEHLASNDMILSPYARNLILDFLTKLTATHGTSTVETMLPLSELLTHAIPRAFHVGTGLSITDMFASEIANASSEVLFVTCFWASSQSREALCKALRMLNIRAVDRGQRIRVRIGFSSSSFWQKLLHTSSPRGHVYPPQKWKRLGLPGPEELDSLDLEVKSLFFLPFSVLHGKFCVIDRRRLFLPSANVSWETWGECCMAFQGELVQRFVRFWGCVWGTPEEALDTEHPENWTPASGGEARWDPPAGLSPLENVGGSYPVVFVPQPHHRNPRFALGTAVPPVTPQNAFLLSAIEHAEESVYLQTPNLTSQPLIAALAAAVQRGVAVEIVTCRGMMFVEQLVTTLGTNWTELSVRGLCRRVSRSTGSKGFAVWYYTGAAEAIAGEHEMAKAVQSHIKCLLVDNQITVLGSANGDRASWWTSQEVNVALFGTAVTKTVRERLVEGLGGRLEQVYGEGALGVEPRKGAVEV